MEREKNNSGKIILFILLMLLFFVVAFVVSKFLLNPSNNETIKSEDNNPSDIIVTDKISKTYKLGEEFTYGNYIFTLSKNYTLFEPKKYEPFNGSIIVKLPIKFTTTSENDKTFPYYFMRFIGPENKLIANDIQYSFNDSIAFINNIEPNKEYNGYLYFMYKGKGDYRLEIYNYIDDRIAVEFNVDKEN